MVMDDSGIDQRLKKEQKGGIRKQKIQNLVVKKLESRFPRSTRSTIRKVSTKDQRLRKKKRAEAEKEKIRSQKVEILLFASS